MNFKFEPRRWTIVFGWSFLSCLLSLSIYGKVGASQENQPTAEMVQKVKSLTAEDATEAATIPIDIQRTLQRDDKEEAYPEVAELLSHENWEVRRRAARWLGYCGDRIPKDAAPKALKAALHDPVWEVRYAAYKALSDNKPDVSSIVPEIIASIDDPQTEVRDAALEVLSQLGNAAAPAQNRIIQLLKESKDPPFEAINVLGAIGPPAKVAIPDLEATLEDTYWIRDSVGEAVGKMDAQETLFKWSVSNNKSLRTAAAIGFGTLTKQNNEVIDRLIKLSLDETNWVRAAAATALGKVRPSTEKIARALIESLKDDGESVRQSAAESLGLLEPKFDFAMEPLIEASKDQLEWVREAASEAIAQYKVAPKTQVIAMLEKLIIDNEISYSQTDFAEQIDEFYQPLIDVLQDDEASEEIRGMVIHVQHKLMQEEEFRKRREGLVKLWTDLLEKESAPLTVRATAATALGWSSVDHPMKIPAMLEGVRKAKPGCLRSFIANRIGQATPDGGVEALVEALKDPEKAVVTEACSALEGYEEKAGIAVPALVQVMTGHENEYVRANAMGAISEIGTNLDKAIPIINQHVINENSELQYSAVCCVKEILEKTKTEKTQFVAPLVAGFDSTTNETSGMRHQIMMAFAQLGDSATPAVVERIKSALNVDDEYTRIRAADAAGKIGEKAKLAAAGIVKMLSDEKRPGERKTAVIALARMKANADAAIPAARILLADLNQRTDVLRAIIDFGELAAPMVPDLEKIVADKDSSYWEKQTSMEALVVIGEPAMSALPTILKLLESEDRGIRKLGEKMAMQLAPENEAVLAAVLGGMDLEYDTEPADELFKEMSKEKVEAILRTASESSSMTARLNARKLMPKYGSKADYIAMTKAALKDSDPEIQLEAALDLLEASSGSLSGSENEQLISILLGGLGRISESGTGDSWRVTASLSKLGTAADIAVVDTMLDAKTPGEAKFHLVNSYFNGVQAFRVYAVREALKSKLATLSAVDPTKSIGAALLTKLSIRERNDANLELVSQALDSKDSWIQRAAMETIGSYPLNPNSSGLSQRQHEKLVNQILKIAASASKTEIVEAAANTLSYNVLDEQHVDQVRDLLKTQPRAALQVLASNKIGREELTNELVEMLKTDKDNQYMILDVLHEHGESATNAIVPIFVDVAGQDESLRENIARALVQMPAGNEEQVAAIRKVLGSEAAFEARWAALILEQWGLADANVLEKLLGLFDENGYSQIGSAMEMTERKLSPEFTKQLSEKLFLSLSDKDKDRNSKRVAFNQLLKIKADPERMVQQAVLLMNESEENYELAEFASALVRNLEGEALDRLVAMGEKSGPSLGVIAGISHFGIGGYKGDERVELLKASPGAIKLLKRGIDSEDPKVAREAAMAMGLVDSTNVRAVEVLIENLDDSENRYEIGFALSRFGANAKPALPKLLKMLDDPQWASVALECIGNMKEAAAPALPQIVKLLDDRRYGSTAQMALRNLGPHAKAMIPELLKRLDGSRNMLSTVDVLATMGPDANVAMPIIEKFLKDEESRYHALRAIGRIGEHGRSATRKLAIGLTKDTRLALACCGAIRGLGEHAEEAVPALIKAASHTDPEVRAEVAIALGTVKGDHQLIVPALDRLLKDSDLTTRKNSGRAARNYGKHAAPLVPGLLQLLKDHPNDRGVMTLFPSTLVEIGPAAKVAIPQLRSLYNDNADDEYYRRQVAHSIWKLDPASAKEMKLDPVEGN